MYGIFIYIWLICIVHVGKYTSPMDGMGFDLWSIFDLVAGKGVNHKLDQNPGIEIQRVTHV